MGHLQPQVSRVGGNAPGQSALAPCRKARDPSKASVAGPGGGGGAGGGVIPWPSAAETVCSCSSGRLTWDREIRDRVLPAVGSSDIRTFGTKEQNVTE